MAARVNHKGQVIIPKRVRDALGLAPGAPVEFDINQNGEVIIHKAGARAGRERDRFEAVRGRADVKWRTGELMSLLRGEA